MSDKIVHYKKSFVKYVSSKYQNYLPIDFYVKKLMSSYHSSYVPKKGFWKPEGSTTAITEEEFTKNYGNKYVHVGMERVTLVIEEDDNKIALKVYTTHKFRSPGTTYFTNRKSTRYITFNKRTNNFYFGYIEKKLKKIVRKSVRVNTFGSHSFNDISLLVRRLVRDIIEVNLDAYLTKSNYGTKISAEFFEVFLKLFCDNKGDLISVQNGVTDIDVIFFEIYLRKNNFKYK